MLKLAAILKWFISSKWGLTILLCAAVLVGAGLATHLFAKHHYNRGKADCTADIIAKTATENQRIARLNVQRNADASVIAKEADTAGASVVKEVDAQTNSTKEVIRYVYRDAPRTKPVAPGSCVHPVDKRVQDRFAAGVRAANG